MNDDIVCVRFCSGLDVYHGWFKIVFKKGLYANCCNMRVLFYTAILGKLQSKEQLALTVQPLEAWLI